MIDLNTEKCRACTIKHLSAALAALEDDDKLAPAYYCGNLVHAANHFMQYDQTISAQIRQLRLDSQDERLAYTLDKSVIKERLSSLIQAVKDFQEPAKGSQPEALVVSPTVVTPTKTSGCRCRKH